MPRIAIVSDIHYAGPGEKARGSHYEFDGVPLSLGRTLAQLHRHFLWLRNPLAHNELLDDFIGSVNQPDLVIANGDYSCDSAAIGLSDDAACESAQLCLGRLRNAFGPRLHAVMGDHELGKVSLLGDRGGLRLRSYERATRDCGLRRFWRHDLGHCVLLGVTSTLIALPAFGPDVLPEERAGWAELRAAHLAEIRAAFHGLKPDQRVILFCHDPTALPFLWDEPEVRERAGQIAQTIIGHLHTRLVFWQSRLLAGIPPMDHFGVALHRMTKALNQAKGWEPFRVELCPSLAGSELLKDGGFLTLDMEETAQLPPRMRFHPLRRRKAG
jgi:hypothetical protein